ncbi:MULTISPECIES: tRNA (N(6)-L-threonylcarbamoyladenosine(37)-C(2))-methylthiotransferase MtaB [unclassified Beijerinckia]|uniref:tRNA (N(6)-L-threonylcarbamoyladenosine(37)-C(2))- methylthiotransferase MtaB n=1 Tax=unclassified Beijerinckia TaxID=2638183 RepID=UPI00089BD476|nr:MULTISPECIES: tRNA (N(6)-L-threonylcarbamoyladenosine(37)-C(2))-methylthiotransferase MtaB [unclassified Beijerinckia]MDH7798230.1 threonylcarbamoyladenosine tRNA methylthiotransferase MtaB [Beijerinckia sp. GAS462]SED13676.1 threonylcarbamoyladenosine tRNA methylthiotransferase MtaB [Beijerinckia sp. 28-YEA-48]
MNAPVRHDHEVDVVTFGCRLNTIESEAIRRAATSAGHRDVVVFNTCAVTNEAVRQARQAIRRTRRERPDAQIVVTGCAAQIDSATFAAMPEVTRVIGNGDKTKPATWTELRTALDFGIAATAKARVNDIMALPETAHHFVASGDVDAIEGHTRAFVEIQNGCDHRCTFCIIPYGRGPSRSAPMGDVVEQIRRLVGNGYREAVLTGVDITSYGDDLPGKPSLGRLVQHILRHVQGLERLRLSSIDCIEADAALLDVIAGDKRFMPHLHLSLQAGDDMILKRMKRRHLRDDAIRFCADIKAARPDMIFGCDIIAGFPTETEAMFQRSLDLVDDCSLTHLHVFPFSPRPGTPAARMPPVDGNIIRERAARLRAKGEERLRLHLDSQIGRTLNVLGERGGIGRAEDFTPVRIGEAAHGQIVEATITGHDGALLLV